MSLFRMSCLNWSAFTDKAPIESDKLCHTLEDIRCLYVIYLSDPTEDGEAMMDGPETPAWADTALFEPNEAGEDPTGNDAEKEWPIVTMYLSWFSRSVKLRESIATPNTGTCTMA